MVTKMRKMRTDDPATNPQMRVDAVPDRGRRVVVSNDPRPAAQARKADAKPAPAPAPRRDPIKDAQDVTSARRDEAIATIGQAWRNPRKPAQAKAPGDKLRQPKPDARQTAHDAIRNAYKGGQ